MERKTSTGSVYDSQYKDLEKLEKGEKGEKGVRNRP